ncbi:farnesol dehydrogenase-like [Rhynchophorus ferrugineus]|uniref:farnesol dehydrogenase-like n=1 Tax=Rhynchophorus ferrugineus TaxID=354439 RepID=UPI003FCC60D8
MNRWVGTVAVVTGCSSGIGQAIAEALVKNGIIVAGLARRIEILEKQSDNLRQEKGKLYGFKCDVTKSDQIINSFKAITETLGPISILVNNAGINLEADLIDGDIDKWRQIMDTNVMALNVCTREAISSMKAHDIKGHIIHINSISGHMLFEVSGFSLYSATKHAVTTLTEVLRREIISAKLPIKLTSISPGVVKTNFFLNSFGEDGDKVFEGRPYLSSQDIAENVMYVLSTPEHVDIKELTVVTQGYLY